MIFRLAREAGVKISPEVATCLYTAVLTDTGSFCFSGTNERTFALAQELVRCGADPVRIAHNVYFSTQLSKMRLLGAALNSLHRDGSLAWMHVDRADHGTLPGQRRRLRRIGQLRVGHRRHRGGIVLPGTAGRRLPREPAQQGRGQCCRSRRAVSAAVVTSAPADARCQARYRSPPSDCWRNFGFAVTTRRCSSHRQAERIKH